jgi:hypothetical protein
MVTPAHEGVVGRFLEDLRASRDEAAAAPGGQAAGMAALYGMIGAMPDRTLARDFVLDFLNQIYAPDEEG